MIATIENLSVLDEAEVLTEMITHSDIAENYRQCKARLTCDDEAQQLIKKFVILKDKYDEVQRFGRYHPEYKTVIKDMMHLKRDLDMNDTIASFKKAEEALESLLNDISASFAGAVSPSIKVPNGDPFFDRGCGGGCGTGSGCSCG